MHGRYAFSRQDQGLAQEGHRRINFSGGDLRRQRGSARSVGDGIPRDQALAKILYDVSVKMKEEQVEAMQKAGTDGLTGLANKAAFEEKIESRILQDRVFLSHIYGP